MEYIKDAPWIGNPDYGHKQTRKVTVRHTVIQEVIIDVEDDEDPIKIAKGMRDSDWDNVSIEKYEEL